MIYQSLYNKYRPTIFAEVIGQDIIVKSLKNCISNQDIPLSYIFSGPKGTGKTTIARIFAKAINCLSPKDGEPCNKCKTCELFNQNKTFDLIEVDAASNNGVENIRAIIENSNYIPTDLKYRVYIIDEAHMLTISAWNALLKTLEEGKPYAVFIFATTEVYKIPSTITSRCLQYRFKALQASSLKTLITKVINAENIKIEQEAIERIIEIADGSGRDVLGILEQIIMASQGKISTKDVNTQFGLIDNSSIINFINHLLYKDTKSCLEFIDYWLEHGCNMQWFMNSLLQVLFDNLIYLQTNNESLLKKISIEDIKTINGDYNTIKTFIRIWLNIKINSLTSSEAKFHILNAIFNCINEKNTITDTGITKINKQPEQIIPIQKIEKPIIQDKKPDIAPTRIQTQNSTSKEISIKEIFFSICKNHSKQMQNSIEIFVANLKNKHFIDAEELSTFSNIQSIPIASKKGFIVIYDDKNDVDLFNVSTRLTVNFLKELEKHLKSVYYVIALDKATLKEWGREFKELNEKNHHFVDLDVIYLYERIKSNNPIIDLMKEYIK